MAQSSEQCEAGCDPPDAAASIGERPHEPEHPRHDEQGRCEQQVRRGDHAARVLRGGVEELCRVVAVGRVDERLGEIGDDRGNERNS